MSFTDITIIYYQHHDIDLLSSLTTIISISIYHQSAITSKNLIDFSYHVRNVRFINTFVVISNIISSMNLCVKLNYTEGVFTSSGRTHSTLFDAHIIFIFSRQYHINCLCIQKHVQFHICIYFRFLAVCITLIAKPTCIYFRFSAVNITLIANFLSTL